MTKLKLGPLPDDKPVKVTLEVSARLLPQDKCLDTGDDLFVVDEAIEELLPIFG